MVGEKEKEGERALVMPDGGKAVELEDEEGMMRLSFGRIGDFLSPAVMEMGLETRSDPSMKSSVLTGGGIENPNESGDAREDIREVFPKGAGDKRMGC